MTADDVRQRVERIRRMAGDDEAAHSEEDKLYREVLRHIASNERGDWHPDLASEALKTQDIKFARWCA